MERRIKSISVLGDNGQELITVKETADRKAVVVCLEDDSQILTVELSPSQWDELCGLRYELECRAQPPAPASVSILAECPECA